LPAKTRGRLRKKPANAAAPGARPRVAEEGLDRYIASQLKAIYDEVAAEPIPDRLLQLLDRLDDDGKR
jgi:anti-sigma factor NepR-like protein